MKLVLVSLLCCGGLAGSDEAIRRMTDEKLSPTQRNEACFVLRGVRSEEANQAMRRMLASDPVRACAASNLRESNAVNELKAALLDENPAVRAVAARELGIMARPELMEALAKAALDPNILVATNAVFALCQYKDRSVVPYLLDLAKGAGIVNMMALKGAAEFHDPQAIAIARGLAVSGDPPARMYAINVIGEMGDVSDLPQLRKIATSNERLSPVSRGFGLLPAIDISRAAKTAIASIEKRTPK